MKKESFRQKNALDAYVDRLDTCSIDEKELLKMTSLYKYCSTYHVDGKSLGTRRKKPVCPRPIPRMEYHPHSRKHEDYCRQMITLHIPWEVDPQTLILSTDWKTKFDEEQKLGSFPTYVDQQVRKYNNRGKHGSDDKQTENDDELLANNDEEKEGQDEFQPPWAFVFDKAQQLRAEEQIEMMEIPPEYDWFDSYSKVPEDEKETVTSTIRSGFRIFGNQRVCKKIR